MSDRALWTVAAMAAAMRASRAGPLPAAVRGLSIDSRSIEPQDAFFRLLLVVLESVRQGGNIWTALTYFDLWSVRLAGFLPDLGTARGICAESQELAAEMLRRPLAGITPRQWEKKTAHDLRRFLSRQMEMHIERSFKTRSLLEALDS